MIDIMTNVGEADVKNFIIRILKQYKSILNYRMLKTSSRDGCFSEPYKFHQKVLQEIEPEHVFPVRFCS